MKAKATRKYQGINKGDEGEFVEDDRYQGAYVGRKKPYGYFEFSNNTGNIKLSVRLVKDLDFNIIEENNG